MKDVETLIYSRLTGDAALVALLDGSTHIKYAFQSGAPVVPQLTFFAYTSGPGLLVGDFSRTILEFYQFNIYSNSHPDVAFRLKRLFDGCQFVVPSNYAEIGSVSSVFDWEGPDGFDESLEVMRKDMRFRFFVAPKAQNPI